MIFLFLILAFSAVTVELPAVVNGEGTQVYLEVEKINKSGVYVYAGNELAEDTLKSILTAYRLVKPKHGFLLTFNNKRWLEAGGPSGGLYFALLFYGLDKNLKIRNDTIVTGAIDEKGNVLPVGGIPEKLAVAKKLHKKYFLSPLLSLTDWLLIQNEEGMKVVEVKNLREAIEFFFFNKTPKEKREVEEKKVNVSNAAYDEEEMKEISKEMIEKLKNIAKEVKIKKDWIREEIEEEINYIEEIYKRGYYYTAANKAFLLYSYLYGVLAVQKNFDLNYAYQRAVSTCNISYYKPSEDIEFYATANLRLKWANTTLNEVRERIKKGQILDEEKVVLFRKIKMAEEWCNLARFLGSKRKERKINASIFKNLAEEAVKHLKDSEDKEKAEEFLENKMYVEAILQNCFAMNDTFVLQNYSTFWGKAYANNEYFLSVQEGKNISISACFEKKIREMKELIKKERESKPTEEEKVISIFFFLTFSMFVWKKYV